ncbi:hypothetical protein NQ314_008716 [Rhamnusium bicolor]|uniref:Sugar phosphate transporter domain-containing protein n=1 Tax=Rhamnusium bicolor TaxID=1586634 RepID=A0AAV8Y638_9CUCU|nr:hypothetical protein NQ314_008716 [Rhamnusium bicolor]
MLVEQSLLSKYVTIFLVVSGYWIVSISTVFVNKTLLSHINLEAPMFIALSQTLITAFICYIKKNLSKMFPSKFRFPDIDIWDSYTVKAILPLSLLFTAMISTNNLCLKYASVTYYYIGRSLTTIFNVLFTYLILGERTSRRCVLCCAIIISGFWLGVDQENLSGSLSTAGFVFGILGSLSLSLFSIFTKKFTSALTHNISGTAKACAQTVLATYWYQETKSLLWWSSNMIVLVGSACYTWIKQIDMERRHRENVNYQRV